MQSSKQGMRKWYHFSTEGIPKGYPFCEKWYKKGQGVGPRSVASLYNKIYNWSANNIARAGFRGSLHLREEDPRRRINFTLGLHAEILVRVVHTYRMFEKEFKMAGDKDKHTIWALLLSLLALTTTFQQNYHNYNQLVVTPNEMVGLYCRD